VKHLVIGAGEVGTALHAVLSRAHDTTLRDVEPVTVGADVLHVCFPWSAQFVEHVRRYRVEHGADLVVVHSTVPPGTCDAESWVHSPVRGRHPHLEEGLTAFVKHFGGQGAALAAKPFTGCGVHVELHERAIETEAAKVWELISFGAQVKIEQAIHDWCAERGVDHDTVYRAFAETYNHGYRALGEDRFVRPILEHVPGPIGGHCIRQNAALIDHPLAAWVAE
jgi:hypothetical protein